MFNILGAEVCFQAQGRLVAFASLKTNFSAAKAAIIHLNQTAALELIKHRVNVNGIAPGVIDTPMWGTAWRFDLPDDIAGAAVFLASDDAEYVVAQTLNVDGGNRMN